MAICPVCGGRRVKFGFVCPGCNGAGSLKDFARTPDVQLLKGKRFAPGRVVPFNRRRFHQRPQGGASK